MREIAYKQILFHSAAREGVLRGAMLLADAVCVTLGPKLKLIQTSWGAPIVCNDGVTIAKQFDLKDPKENLGAQVVRQAAERTGDVVGDGTSTSIILAHRDHHHEAGRDLGDIATRSTRILGVAAD
jgi:chaperonin GroEL